jgi:hypothetical protein
MKNYRIKLSVILLFVFSTVFYAQELKHNQSNWFAYVGQYNVSKKWGYHIEAQFRLDDELNRSNQNLFRLGGFYNLNEKIKFSMGYGLINTLNSNLNDYFNEDRIWEQFQYSYKWKQNINTNRFRLEQRFVDRLALENGSVIKSETNYQNRLRYLNRNIFHIMNFKSGNEELYLVLQDEVFINLGTNKVNNQFIDQNRFHIGFGINYKKSIQFEVSYMNHFINANTNNDIMSHTISLTLLQNLILYKE